MITLWDGPDSMRASAHEADQLRQRTADMSDQKITNVALYDISRAQTVARSKPELVQRAWPVAGQALVFSVTPATTLTLPVAYPAWTR